MKFNLNIPLDKRSLADLVDEAYYISCENADTDRAFKKIKVLLKQSLQFLDEKDRR